MFDVNEQIWNIVIYSERYFWYRRWRFLFTTTNQMHTSSKTTSGDNNHNERTEQTSDICIVVTYRECVAARLHPGHPRPHHVQPPLALLHFDVLHNQQHLLRRHLACGAATGSEKFAGSQKQGQITGRIVVWADLIQCVVGFFSLEFARVSSRSRIMQPIILAIFFTKTAWKLNNLDREGALDRRPPLNLLLRELRYQIS